MTTIPISSNFYQLIRDQTINDHNDALVELITNSIDAYKRSNQKDNKIIDIYWENDSITVIDQAIGLDSHGLNRCFLQVGNYTSSYGHRGFFSRGAKDVSALGNLTITAIKDNKISQCLLTNNLMGSQSIMDQEVTAKDRLDYKIANNGLHFKVSLLDTYKLSADKINDKVNKLTKHFNLRGYFSDTSYIITSYWPNSTNINPNQKLHHKYENPEGTLLVEIYGNLEKFGYPEATYTFSLWKSEFPLGDPIAETDNRYIEFGIKVFSNQNIHDNCTLYPQIRYESNIAYLFGELHCDYIDVLMNQYLDIDAFDKSKNPFPIIDSGRVNGVNRAHPFTKALYEYPYQRLLYILSDLSNKVDDQHEMDLGDLAQLFDDQIDCDVLQSLQTTYGRFDPNLIKKIKNNIVNTNDITENNDLPYSKNRIKHNVDDLMGQPKRLQIVPRFTSDKLKNNVDYEVKKTLMGYVIYVSTTSSLLKDYVNHNQETKEITGFSSIHTRVILTGILVNAVCDILTGNNMNNNLYNVYDVFNKFNHYYGLVKPVLYKNIVEKPTLRNIMNE